MFTYFISFASGIGGYAAAHFAAGIGNGWSVAIGFAVLIAVQLGLSWHFMKKLKVEMGGVQSIMAEGQKAIQAKVARWQIRPPGSIAEAQRIIFEDTCSFVKRAIAEADKLKKYRLWVPMIDRQIATAKFQLNWMIKNFKEVDRFEDTPGNVGIFWDGNDAWVGESRRDKAKRTYSSALVRCPDLDARFSVQNK